jgi:hypothetical protein
MVEFADFNHGPKENSMTDIPLIELLQKHDEGDFLRAVTEAVRGGRLLLDRFTAVLSLAHFLVMPPLGIRL